ncbi:glycine cleavage system protein GcvH [Natranaerofaba carboxydovora]|uniref:glycine cleavage system protein GcvH n=1 Tax=Natranaerofaba carboxydovora TaxID=2742683 RepID=UPI001F132D90|nr:glycine cleavage system protein GcvH [Natranaerofaba carboxydovora]UMZ73974.1 Glycine cleavage system H protein [Natranaerofaba carboxydovora]
MVRTRPDLSYTKEHEWVKVEDGKAYVGITYYAQEQLGDIVFVELPEVDDDFSRDEEVCVVESVKAVADIYAPISGTIEEVNEKLLDNPEIVNSDPYGEGWLFMMSISDEGELNDLLTAEEYEKILEEEGEG